MFSSPSHYPTRMRPHSIDQYRKSPRAMFLDYDGGDFFITICTKNKKHYFGEIHDGAMHLSDIGIFIDNQLTNAHNICCNIAIPIHIVMPNHIHAIVRLLKETTECEDSNQRNPNPMQRPNPTCQRHVPTLSRYINSFKGAATKYARSSGIPLEWQTRYHDHLIRTVHEGNRIAEYIANNVENWNTDRFFGRSTC